MKMNPRILAMQKAQKVFGSNQVIKLQETDSV